MNCTGPNCAKVRRLSLVAASITAAFVLGCSGSDSSDGQENAVAARGGASVSSRIVGGSGASERTSATATLAAGGHQEAGGHQASGGLAPSGVANSGGDIGAGAVASGSGVGRSSGGWSSNGGSQAAMGGRGVVEASGGAMTIAGRAGSGDLRGSGGATHNGGAPSGVGGRVGTGAAASSGAKTSGGQSNSGSSGGGKSNAGARNFGGTAARGGSGPVAGTANGGRGDSCYTAPAEPIGTAARADTVNGYGTVSVWARSPHQIVRVQTTLVVPPKPPASGTLFLWPGLQPYGANFDPIDNGVLQPVLTWGPACAPIAQPRTYSTWWISGQYVNTNGSVPGYTDCNSGPAMSVNVCDKLEIELALTGTVWRQTVMDPQVNQTVTYDIDMQNQAQNIAYFVIEEYSSTPVSEVIFTDTTITFDTPDAADCRVYLRGQNDFVSSPTASSDGLRCSIPQIILRAQGLR